MVNELGNGEAETDGGWLRCSFPVLKGGTFAEGEKGLANKKRVRSWMVVAHWDTKAAGPI